MRNTKTITMSAMLLAVAGAMFLADRAMASFFSTIVCIAAAVIVLIEIMLFGYRMGAVMAFGIMIMAFLFGSTYILFYMPLAIGGAFVYALAIKNKTGSLPAVIMTAAVYIVGEFVMALLVLPLLGYDAIGELGSSVGEIFAAVGIDLGSDDLIRLFKISVVMSLALTGFLEGALMHLISAMILKRMHLTYIAPSSPDSLKLPPLYAYGLLGLVFCLILVNSLAINDIIYYIVSCLGILAALTLIFQAYVFILRLGMVRRRNYGLSFIAVMVLLFPYSLAIAVIAGFLYATGPLERYLDTQRSKQN